MVINFHKIVFILLIGACSGSPVNSQTIKTGWTGKEADICFVLDCSSSVWIVDFRNLTAFVADLISDMDIRPSATRVGVGVFSEDFKLYIPINNSFSKEGLKTQTKNAPYLKGNAYLSRALKGVREQCLTSSNKRPHVPQIAVLFTDGMSRHKQLTADNTTLVKKDGIFIFTVGIGNEVDKEEMKMIASDPKLNFNYHLPSFDRLIDIRSKLSTKMSEVELFQGEEGTCGDKVKVDTVFVFDEAAVGANNTLKIKAFIKGVVNGLNVNSGNVRVGVVSKTCHEGDITFGQYITKEDFAVGLDNNDGPEISELLKRVRLNAFLPENGARSDAKSRIVIILHAEVAKKTDTIREAQRAKYAGIEIFVIRLGNDYVKDFINSLASSVANTEFFDSADVLMQTNSIKDFSSKFCRDL